MDNQTADYNPNLFELLLLFDGEDAEQAEFWPLIRMAEKEKLSSTEELCLFGAMKELAEIRVDLLDGSIQQEPWASVMAGWTLIYRNCEGISLWYHPKQDYLMLQRGFNK